MAKIEYSVLFVCTGNTCRSPMAEGIAKRVLAERKRVPIDQLESAGVRVRSAGTTTGVPQARDSSTVFGRLSWREGATKRSAAL